MKDCPQCHAPVADNAKFCMECGFNIKQYEEQQKPNFCPQCGTPHKGGKFCAECGHQFVAPAAPVLQPALTTEDSDAFAEDWLLDIKGMTATSVKAEEKRRKREKWEQLFVDFNYTEHTDGSVTITELKNKQKLSLTVPHGVVAIADEAFKNGEFVDIALPKSLVKIGARAFFGCRFLKSIALPTSLQVIDDEAFANCTALEITLPKGLKVVGQDVIKNTASERRRIEEDARRAREAARAEKERKAEEQRRLEAEQKALEEQIKAEKRKAAAERQRQAEEKAKAEKERREKEAEKKRLEEEAKAAKIAADFEISGTLLKKYRGREAYVSVPDFITEICSYAFSNTTVQYVLIPMSVSQIDHYAFKYCPLLQEVTFKYRLGWYAFKPQAQKGKLVNVCSPKDNAIILTKRHVNEILLCVDRPDYIFKK